MMRCRFSAAIVWQWTRSHNCRLRIRPVAVAGLVASAVIASLGPTLSLVVPVGVLAAGVAETVVLRSAVRRALDRSAPADPAGGDATIEVSG